jgi:HSP20 family protein
MESIFNLNFDKIFSSAWDEIYNGIGRVGLIYPQVNAFLDNDKIQVNLLYPGVKKEQLKLKIEDDLLIISGEFKDEEKEMKYYIKEFRPVNFVRKFRLPEEVKKKEIAAVYEDGVLKISIPIDKKKEKEKKFDINIG